MDTTYISTMLVAFLVVAALAVSIGYMYVDEDDLLNIAEVSALKGAQGIKQGILAQLKKDPARLDSVVSDTVQSSARNAASDQALGKHKESALTHALNNSTNRLSNVNDMTVGFWNISSLTYTPGGTPVNAMQVRTRRTAESDAVGIGKIGSFLGIISGVQKFDYTPDAIAALPAKANASFALCTAACDISCTFPNVCPVPERKMVSLAWGPGMKQQVRERLASTYLMYQMNSTFKLSDMICMETPSQDVCRKEILTTLDPHDSSLADMESMMYNPNVDVSNKEYDTESGLLKGWWVIAPVADCPTARADGSFQKQTVTKYALVRISKICASGPTGCQQNNTSFDSPSSVCGSDKGLYIDRISCVNCGSRAMLAFPGLHPVLVK